LIRRHKNETWKTISANLIAIAVVQFLNETGLHEIDIKTIECS